MLNSNDPWDELNLVDSGYEQAEEATRRLGNLVRVFYLSLVAGDGIPMQVAAPITIHYAQAILLMATKKATEPSRE